MKVCHTEAPWSAGRYHATEPFALMLEHSYMYEKKKGLSNKFEEYTRNGLFRACFDRYMKLGKYYDVSQNAFICK